MVLSGCVVLSAQENYNTLVYEGNRSFDKKNYDAAASKYMNAVKINGKDFTAHYNLGNALYKRKKYDEALAEYQKAESLAKNRNDRVAATYNLGNAYMQSGKAEKAAEYYKKALKQDPYNEKIRKNYEVAMLKKNQQNQQNQKNENNNGKGGNNKDQNNSDNNKGKNPQNGGNGNQNQNKGDGSQSDKNKNQNGNSMPKDLQDAIMNRVKNKEQETARKILNKNSYSEPQSNEKDW